MGISKVDIIIIHMSQRQRKVQKGHHIAPSNGMGNETNDSFPTFKCIQGNQERISFKCDWP